MQSKYYFEKNHDLIIWKTLKFVSILFKFINIFAYLLYNILHYLNRRLLKISLLFMECNT